MIRIFPHPWPIGVRAQDLQAQLRAACGTCGALFAGGATFAQGDALVVPCPRCGRPCAARQVARVEDEALP